MPGTARLLHRPVRLCVRYGIGLTQKYKSVLSVTVFSAKLLIIGINSKPRLCFEQLMNWLEQRLI